MKFTADYNLRLPVEEGSKIMSDAQYIGRSGYEKGSYWAAWEMDGNYYISLNDWIDYVWQVTEEDAKNYIGSNKEV